jgi:anion-transporting  ArsA/GET3 family ATPase
MTTVPRVLFVVGKGGVGRSSIAAALGACFAGRGENTLIVGLSTRKHRDT